MIEIICGGYCRHNTKIPEAPWDFELPSIIVEYSVQALHAGWMLVRSLLFHPDGEAVFICPQCAERFERESLDLEWP